MDVVEAGRERVPVRSAWYVAGGVLLALLAVAGTLRATGLPHVYRDARRTPPTRGPYVPLPVHVAPSPIGNKTVSESMGRPLPPGDGVRLTVTSTSWAVAVDTRDDARTTLYDTGSARVLRGFVPLRYGFAALDGTRRPEDGTTLVVRDGERETTRRLPRPSFLVPGGDDTEFWVESVEPETARRYDRTGHPLGPAVVLPERTVLVRGAPGGGLVVLHDTTVRLWDPVTRRTLWSLAGTNVLAGAGRYLVSTLNCVDTCPPQLTDLATGRTRSVPWPAGATLPTPIAVGPAGDVAYATSVSGTDTITLFVVPHGAARPLRVATDLTYATHLAWAGRRLVTLENVDAAEAVSVVRTWDQGTRTLRLAGVYDPMDAAEVTARAV